MLKQPCELHNSPQMAHPRFSATTLDMILPPQGEMADPER